MKKIKFLKFFVLLFENILLSKSRRKKQEALKGLGISVFFIVYYSALYSI